MDIDNLVLMANRIGDFFDAMPDREEAVAGVRDHLIKFWEPRMLKEMARHLETADGAGLQPLVLEAFRTL